MFLYIIYIYKPNFDRFGTFPLILTFFCCKSCFSEATCFVSKQPVDLMRLRHSHVASWHHSPILLCVGRLPKTPRNAAVFGRGGTGHDFLDMPKSTNVDIQSKSRQNNGLQAKHDPNVVPARRNKIYIYICKVAGERTTHKQINQYENTHLNRYFQRMSFGTNNHHDDHRCSFHSLLWLHQDCAPLRLRIFGYTGRPWHVLKAKQIPKSDWGFQWWEIRIPY